MKMNLNFLALVLIRCKVVDTCRRVNPKTNTDYYVNAHPHHSAHYNPLSVVGRVSPSPTILAKSPWRPTASTAVVVMRV